MRTILNNTGLESVCHDELSQKTVRDSYKVKRKLPEPTLCPGCGAVFKDGCWQWQELSVAYEALCPACHRQHDNVPAGFIALSGDFVAAHEAIIFRVVLNQEECEKVKYPLRRVMDIKKSDDGFMVTTTDVQLARDIGEALHHAFNGNLELNYNRQASRLMAHWNLRDSPSVPL
jgi:NMD protein affecting ribosome stability and mRNA decay